MYFMLCKWYLYVLNYCIWREEYNILFSVVFVYRGSHHTDPNFTSLYTNPAMLSFKCWPYPPEHGPASALVLQDPTTRHVQTCLNWALMDVCCHKTNCLNQIWIKVDKLIRLTTYLVNLYWLEHCSKFWIPFTMVVSEKLYLSYINK